MTLRHTRCFAGLPIFTLLAGLQLGTQIAIAQEQSFQQLESSVSGLLAAGDPNGEVPGIIEAWLKPKDLNQLGRDEVAWCLRNILPNKTERTVFSVVWTGVLTAPRSDDFVFSTSPINVNKTYGLDRVRHNIIVELAGKTVVDTGPHRIPTDPTIRAKDRGRHAFSRDERWDWRGAPIALQAGEGIPIRVEMQFECEVHKPGNSPSAILYWEGPGINRQPVPSEAFMLPDESANGLNGEYRFANDDEAITIEQITPSLEFAWATASSVAPQKPELVDQLTQRLWILSTEQSYIAECAEGRTTHAYFEEESSTDFLSTSQREQFSKLLQSTPELLNRADNRQVLRLYRQLRFGAEAAALDMLGMWTQLHTDIAPELSTDFHRDNRHSFEELGLCIGRQLPEHLVTLQDRFLTTSDGNCALPAAYALTYAHAFQGTIDEWTSTLDDVLADESLTGDQRINWLLARAQADEVRLAPGRPDPMATSGWLDEASLVVESPAARLRIARERVARLTALRLWEQADAELQAAAAPPAWRTQLVQVERDINAASAEEAAQAHASLIREFERRRRNAADRGDAGSEARYAQKLLELQAVAE